VLALSLVRAIGGSGTVAARIKSVELRILLPALLIACSLKLYVNPPINPVKVNEVPTVKSKLFKRNGNRSDPSFHQIR
jgi:hypothetical protein